MHVIHSTVLVFCCCLLACLLCVNGVYACICTYVVCVWLLTYISMPTHTEAKGGYRMSFLNHLLHGSLDTAFLNEPEVHYYKITSCVGPSLCLCPRHLFVGTQSHTCFLCQGQRFELRSLPTDLTMLVFKWCYLSLRSFCVRLSV